MTIDIENEETLKLRSSRETFFDSLIYINSSGERGISNAYYELTKTTNIKDKDLSFIIHFLKAHNYLIVHDKTILLTKKFNPKKLIVHFCSYYLLLIQSNSDINTALFLNSDFTIEKDSIIIKVKSIPLSYRPYLFALEKLELVERASNNEHVKVLNYVLAKKVLERPLRKISQKDFDAELEQRKIRGDKAELFVLNLEKEKLKGSSYSPKRVSQENVGLGYDIESYEIDGARIFIEVKSLRNGKMFYWSNNEIGVSKRLGKHYLIYTILFNNIGEPLKIKETITDPYKEIFVLEKFTKEPSGDYLITLTS